jgi:hypothetical protein
MLKHPRAKETNVRHERDGFDPIHRAAWGLQEGHTATVAEFIAHDPFSVLKRSRSGYIPSELAARVAKDPGGKQAEKTAKIIHESLHVIKAQRNERGFLKGAPAPKIDFSQYFGSKTEL